jgi:hypothetical protein
VGQLIRLEAWFETGMEGTEWIGNDFLAEQYKWVWQLPSFKQVLTYPSFKKKWKFDPRVLRKVYLKPYETIVTLKDGDMLTIFEDYTATKVLWKGRISKDCGNDRVFYDWPTKLIAQYEIDFDIKPSQESLKKYGFRDDQISDWNKINAIFKECFSQQSSNGLWCHWIQNGVNADIWGKYFIDNRYAYLESESKTN